MGLPIWLWWLFVPLGASVLVGGLAFGVGHMIRSTIPHHDPDCGCKNCTRRRETAKEHKAALRRIAEIERRNNPRPQPRADTQGRRPRERVLSTRQLKPGFTRVLVSGTAYRVEHVGDAAQGRMWQVELRNVATGGRSVVRVRHADIDLPRWEVAP